MAKYLITGIAGFIGSNLAHALVRQGHQVAGIDNLSTGTVENLQHIWSSIEFTRGDVRNGDAIRAALRGVDYVLHHAAVASVPMSIEDPLTTHDINVNGTINVLWHARQAGVRRVIYAASSSAYGNSDAGANREEAAPKPLSPYAVQKLTGEYYVQSFVQAYGMEAICLRYFNIFGPRQGADSPYSGVIAKFIRSLMAGESPTIFGDGCSSRDFTFVGDVVQANLLACSAPRALADGRVFNVGTGDSRSLNELYTSLAAIFSHRESVCYGPAREGEVLHSRADIARIRTELGYEPTSSFHAGLEKTVEWYRQGEVRSPTVPAAHLGALCKAATSVAAVLP